MTLIAKEPPCCDEGSHLAASIHVMCHADHWRAGLCRLFAAVTREAFIAVPVDLITPDLMRDNGRLFRIVPNLAFLVARDAGHDRGFRAGREFRVPERGGRIFRKGKSWQGEDTGNQSKADAVSF